MPLLTVTDYEAVLDIVVHVARQPGARVGIDGDVLDKIREIIPRADTVAWWSRDPRLTAHATRVAGRGVPWTAADDRILGRLRFVDPLLPSEPTMGVARRLSDLLGHDEYRATDFYRELGRRHGLEYSLSYWLRLDEERIAGLWLDVSGGDFSARDRALLGFLGRQLQRHIGPQAVVPRDRGALTEREAEILAAAALGQTNGKIAAALSISPHTVRTHLENAFEALGVHTRAAAIARAWELGILPRVTRTVD